MSLLFSCKVMSSSLWPHGLQHTRLPCPSLSPGVCLNSCPLNQWCSLTILSSCHCLFLLPSVFPSIRVFSNELVGSSHQVSRVLELQLQHQSFQWIFRTDFLKDWLVWSCNRRDSQESYPTPQFKSIIMFLFWKASHIMAYGIIYLNQHPIISWPWGATTFSLKCDFESLCPNTILNICDCICEVNCRSELARKMVQVFTKVMSIDMLHRNSIDLHHPPTPTHC